MGSKAAFYPDESRKSAGRCQGVTRVMEVMGSGPCRDCPRRCAARGARSFCGTDRPGRIHWRGVTYLEEHEIAPTYEIYFTGCSLRCLFCTVPEAIYRPNEGTWTEVEDLARDIARPDQPPFRTISLVGGDPTVNLPYVRELVPRLRRRLPGKELVLNTNLYFSPDLSEELAASFDWVVGDVHFSSPGCAATIAAARDYPAVATACAERLLVAGARLILRILVLPGHLGCCAEPTARWAAGLAGDVIVNVMTNYAPVGRARSHPTLGRSLSQEERRRAETLLPGTVRRPARRALRVITPRPSGIADPEARAEVDAAGRTFFPFVTGELLPLAAALEPDLAPRLAYLDLDSDDDAR